MGATRSNSDTKKSTGTGESKLVLAEGSRIGVMGGGPAGSFFSYFVLDMAGRIGLDLDVDIYEPRDFSRTAPQGCNMCGGIISETLVQFLATEGIYLPPTVVQRGINSYVMHTDVGSARIETPLHEKRIAAVHRGAGPRGSTGVKWSSFDGHLLKLAEKNGARVLQSRINKIDWFDGRPNIKTPKTEYQAYDLLVATTGVNSSASRLFTQLGIEYQPPKTVKTAIREFYIGADMLKRYLGNSMHVFLMDLPRLEFAAIIPKGDYATVCMLGDNIDSSLLYTFLNTPQVKKLFPPDIDLEHPACQCSPMLSVRGATRPYADRIVFIGDCGVTRLYKDGIGAAYRAAKAAASTAIFQGISSQDFRKSYWPVCRRMEADNWLGKFVFLFVGQMQKRKFARRALVHMVSREQSSPDSQKRLSMIMWDTFTGSAPYQEVFLRSMHPKFLAGFLSSCTRSLLKTG